MELKIISPTEQSAIVPVKFNFEELKAHLEERLALYKNRHYDMSKGTAEAKKDRAALNRLKKSINDAKIGVKKQIMAQYESDFEPKIKELLAMLEECAGQIDGQIKEVENKAKADKLSELSEFYQAEAKELAKIVPFEWIFQDKWLNATFSKDLAIGEIFNAVGKIRSDLKTLDESVADLYKVEVTDTYLATLDLGEALRRNNYLAEQAKKQAEYAKAQAEKKAAQEQAQALNFCVVWLNWHRKG
ncbi:DUF1351 domain-containing protein [Candidatus Proelusimicrobium excrementi]|uniref:DUF1351 domain-containing protein n=1 Tax=Candidatus Proelusimicrobium excrementi TaxID=3416222 RepID=UPI003D10A2F7